MSKATLKQAAKILSVFEDAPNKQIQAILASGLLVDLRDGNVAEVNRDEFRGSVGLKPLNETPKPAPAPFQFKVGRTVRLGFFDTPEQYRSVLEAIGVQIDTPAEQILKQVTVSKTVIEVDLSEPFTVADLGFTGITRNDVIKKRIVELGGGICPNEVGPATRFQYQDQPKGEWFCVAMESLTDIYCGLRMFHIGHDAHGLWSHSLWLSGIDGCPGRLFYPLDRFVCLVPRKK